MVREYRQSGIFKCINKIMNANTKIYGDNSYKYLKSYYSVSVVYKEMESFIK